MWPECVGSLRCAFVRAQNKIVQYIAPDLTNAATRVSTARIVHFNIKSLSTRDIWSLLKYKMAGRYPESDTKTVNSLKYNASFKDKGKEMSEEFHSNDDLVKLSVKMELLTALLMDVKDLLKCYGKSWLEHKLKQFTFACESQSITPTNKCVRYNRIQSIKQPTTVRLV